MKTETLVDQVRKLKTIPTKDKSAEDRLSGFQKTVDDFNMLVKKGWIKKRGNNLLSISDQDKLVQVQLKNLQAE